MTPTEPWETFFDSWNVDTSHLPAVTWSSPVPDVDSPGGAARRRARARTWRHLRHVLGWGYPESFRMVGALSLDLILWLQMDGSDRTRLRDRLRSTYERVLAKAALGRVGEGTPVRLPDACYMPRKTFQGEIRDRMPWPGALTYVTDGLRYGVEYESGRVEWLQSPPVAHLALSGNDFADVPVADVLRGLEEVAELHSVLKSYGQHDPGERDRRRAPPGTRPDEEDSAPTA
jgi:hypothetical protein